MGAPKHNKSSLIVGQEPGRFSGKSSYNVCFRDASNNDSFPFM
jgi:hypothetical protein